MTMTFADLAKREVPYLMRIDRSRTEGRNWTVRLLITDASDGSPIDISGVTWEAKILTNLLDQGGVVVATWSVSGNSSGELTLTLAASATVGKGTGATKDTPRACIWYCKGVKGSDEVQFWGPGGSNFRIWGE